MSSYRMTEEEAREIMGVGGFFGRREIEQSFGQLTPEERENFRARLFIPRYYSRALLEAVREEFMLVAYSGWSPRRVIEKYFHTTGQYLLQVDPRLYHPDRFDENWGVFWYLIRRAPLPQTLGMSREEFEKIVPELNLSLQGFHEGRIGFHYTPYSPVVFWVWFVNQILSPDRDPLLSQQMGILTGDECRLSYHNQGTISLCSASTSRWRGNDPVSRKFLEETIQSRMTAGVLPMIDYKR